MDENARALIVRMYLFCGESFRACHVPCALTVPERVVQSSAQCLGEHQHLCLHFDALGRLLLLNCQLRRMIQRSQQCFHHSYEIIMNKKFHKFMMQYDNAMIECKYRKNMTFYYILFYYFSVFLKIVDLCAFQLW